MKKQNLIIHIDDIIKQIEALEIMLKTSFTYGNVEDRCSRIRISLNILKRRF